MLFGVGRALGVLANIIWDRALGYAIERPKSVTTDMLEKWAAEGGRKGLARLAFGAGGRADAAPPVPERHGARQSRWCR